MSGIDVSNIEKCHNSLVFIYFERGNFSRDDFAEDTIHEISLQRTANSEQRTQIHTVHCELCLKFPNLCAISLRGAALRRKPIYGRFSNRITNCTRMRPSSR